MDELEMRIASRPQEVADVVAALERFARDRGAPPTVIHDLQVAVDEVLANVIAHGRRGPAGEILVRLGQHVEGFVVEVEDDGIAFDPSQAPAPDLSAPLRQRRVGGLGVHLVRSLMDEVSYVRSDGKNVLRLLKRAVRA